LVDLETLCASHIKDAILDCLRKNGFTTDLLQEVFIGFCSDGVSVMLGTKSGVGKLLKDEFPDIVMRHCLNHRLELAVGNAVDATSGTNDLQSFLECLYSLYSQSPKNMRELITVPMVYTSLSKESKSVYCSLGSFIIQSGIGSLAFFSSLSPTFSERFKT